MDCHKINVTHQSLDVYSTIDDCEGTRSFRIFPIPEEFEGLSEELKQIAESMQLCQVKTVLLKLTNKDIGEDGISTEELNTSLRRVTIKIAIDGEIPKILRVVELHFNHHVPTNSRIDDVEKLSNLYESVDSFASGIEPQEFVNNPLQFAQRIFTDGIYEVFKKELHKKVSALVCKLELEDFLAQPYPVDEYNKKCRTLLELIKNNYCQTPQKMMVFHRLFINHLREIVGFEPNKIPNDTLGQSLCSFFDQLTMWYFEESNIYSSLTKALKTLCPEMDQFDEFSLDKALSLFEEYLCEHPEIGCVSPSTNCSHNAAALGDLPYKSFTWKGEGLKIPILRMPNVTYKSSLKLLSLLKLDPIFLRYILLKKRQLPEKRHLFINLLSRGQEKDKSDLIEFLDHFGKTTEFVDVITIDCISTFIWQTGDVDLSHARDFKKACFEHFTGPYYYWSKKIGNQWNVFLEDTIKNIHEFSYNKKSTLSITERRAFIQQMNCQIIDNLLSSKRYGSCNISCFSSVDRAPTMIAQLRLYTWIQDKKEINPIRKIKIIKMVFTPALILFNRNVHKERTNLTAALMASLLNKDDSKDDEDTIDG